MAIDPITGLPLGVANGGFIQPINTTGIPINDVPRTYRPGEQAALEAGVTYNMPPSSQVNQTIASVPPATYNPVLPTQGPGTGLRYNPNDPLSVNATGQNVELGSTQQRTNIVKDPWQDFLMNTILQGSQGSFVPEYTQQALEQFTKNPALAANFFPQLAAPLLEANRAAQDVQTRNTMDMFRKAGGTTGGTLQSGAFAQAGRQLAGDFARQDQEVLAKAYTPLTAQLSENMTNAIRAGLAFPQAQNTAISNLIPLATSLRPLQEDKEVLSAGTSAGAIPQVGSSPSWLSQPPTPLPQRTGWSGY